MKPVDVFASDGKLASVIRTLLNPGVKNRLKFAMEEYSIEILSNTVRNVRRTCQLEKEER